VTKAELRAQVDAMTDEEAAEAELVYAPDWPFKKTSIDEMRKRMGTYGMSLEKREARSGAKRYCAMTMRIPC
jgi:hypothetical protein